VINSNFGRILHHFRDIAAQMSKNRFLPYPPLFEAPARGGGGPHQNFGMKLTPEKLEGWGYYMVKIAWSYLQLFLTDPPVWRTDRRTNRRNCHGIYAL